MDNKGQVSVEWLIIAGAIMILIAAVIFIYQTQTKIGKVKDTQSTVEMKDKIYSI